ncbi:hypothetical protein ACFRAE_17380 [Sphingobacterium sp. HJSM2_6]|uniref:hypothetical protein n=1 Tax=Sphingobacterium sp. HJSM2_6 TaxID=3366264 RepID=UPI003BC88740
MDFNILQIDEELYKVIQILTTNYNIECIYLSEYQKSKNQRDLILLVSNKYLNYIGELTPKMVNSIKNYENYRIKCYVAFQAKEKIKRGSLFLFRSCQQNRLVFQRQDSAFCPIPEDFDAAKCFEKHRQFQEREFQKVIEFRDGYFHFKAKSQYSMAAFMIHQVLEQTYRNLEIILVGKDKLSHSIRCHNSTIYEIYPSYDAIFDPDNNEDEKLLKILEDIYRATRYEDNFSISLKSLERIELKMEALKELFQNICIRFTTDFSETYLLKNESKETVI